jgi:hypothetical protein
MAVRAAQPARHIPALATETAAARALAEINAIDRLETPGSSGLGGDTHVDRYRQIAMRIDHWDEFDRAPGASGGDSPGEISYLSLKAFANADAEL